jgi:PAS domain S-box-containing protein
MEHQPPILIVDDDPGFRKTLSDILSFKGYRAIAFDRGETTLDFIQTEKPLIVLIDLKLEDMLGLDLLKRIKQLAAPTECILLTGYASQSSAIEAVNLGAYGYMQKPYNIDQLLMMIRRAIEKVQAEEALRASEERLRQVLVSVSDHIYMTEITQAGQFINHYLSPNIETITGYAVEEYLTDWNFLLTQVIHPEDKAKAQAQVARLRQGLAGEIEYRIVRQDGRVVWVRDSARAQSKGSSKIIYGVISDITERHQLEDRLRQSQKMEAVGQLAGGIAHDFNNILTVILGNCELIINQLRADDPLRKDVEQIQKSGERAASLTRQLLAFSRKQLLQLQVLDLNTIVLDMEKMLRRLIGEDIQLVTVLDPLARPVKADSGQLEQIILNLVLNARDAMPYGGELTIETANIYLDEDYARRHVDVTPGAYMMLSVTDTGVGMDAETQSHIFEPFFTTKEPGKGTGLGLATIYGIVKQSHGHIWVYSELGEGSVFKVYLPQAEEAVILSDEGFLPVEISNKSETILLVEDEEMVRDLARRVLLNGGYTVFDASDGQEAIQLCQNLSHPIDLLVTDVIMPGEISGRQLAEKLMALQPRIKVIYISGYTDDAIVHHGVLQSGRVFLQKPFTADALLNAVRQVLDE